MQYSPAKKDHDMGENTNDTWMVNYPTRNYLTHHLSQNWFLIRTFFHSRMPLTTGPVRISMVNSSHLSNTNNPFDPVHVCFSPLLQLSAEKKRWINFRHVRTFSVTIIMDATPNVYPHKPLTTARDHLHLTMSIKAQAKATIMIVMLQKVGKTKV